MDQGIEDAVVMDDKTFKSLTSKTRTDILKLLKKRNYTLSEIAEKLKISKTTAKEHLDILVEGRLVEQVPSTNKWKYYALTKDGRKLVGEEGPKRVVITLVAFVIGFVLSVYGFTGFYGSIGGADMMLAAEAPVPETTMAGGEIRTLEAEPGEAPMAIVSEGEIAEDMQVETYNAVPEEKSTAAEESELSMPPPAPMIIPDYVALMLGIVGLAIMGMAALLLFANRKKKRSVI